MIQGVFEGTHCRLCYWIRGSTENAVCVKPDRLGRYVNLVTNVMHRETLGCFALERRCNGRRAVGKMIDWGRYPLAHKGRCCWLKIRRSTGVSLAHTTGPAKISPQWTAILAKLLNDTCIGCIIRKAGRLSRTVMAPGQPTPPYLTTTARPLRRRWRTI